MVSHVFATLAVQAFLIRPHGPLLTSWPNAPRSAVSARAKGGPPPIPSDCFVPLGSPVNYTALTEHADEDTVSVFKFQAPYCRTCRASSPLLDRVAKQFPQAKYYSLDLMRDGKATGERMNRFFKEKGVKLLPYIEIYVGSTCVDTEVVPPSALKRFEQTLGAATERLRAASQSRRGTSRQLVLLRQFLQEGMARAGVETRGGRRRRRAAVADDEARHAPETSDAAGWPHLLASRSWLGRASQRREQLERPWPPHAQSRVRSKRGAPQRGNTGGRRKGWR
jgi:thiol-disulfide isomerase/thioredoxin